MGPLGVQEMVVIFLVALVLFGPKKLPELGKTIAKALTEFRRAQSDLKATYEREMQAIERESESLKEVTRQAAEAITSYSDVDLVGGPNGTYGTDLHSGANEFTPDHPTVSASAVPGAESLAESHSTPYTAYPDEAVTGVSLGVEGTVPRSASSAVQTVAAKTTAPADVANPLPEFVQMGGGSAAKSADADLPSFV
jgi:sec-independent protein translocase protein TatA